MKFSKKEVYILLSMLKDCGYTIPDPKMFAECLIKNTGRWMYMYWDVFKKSYEDLPLMLGHCGGLEEVIISWRLKIGR